MKHLGDIKTVNWFSAEPVDCVTGGSPCQDLSEGGKRAGLAGERSGLYMEQIRSVKELRRADVLRGRTANLCRPRYMVWENVTGAFSSNKGKDFGAVLTEAVRIVQPDAPDVPVPEKGWPYSGCLYDSVGGWSIAWRTHDAKYWGVPQHRSRISLLCDFGGLSAPEILFESKSGGGSFEPSKTPWSRTPGEVSESNESGGGSELSVFHKSSFCQFSEGYGTLRSRGGDNGGGSETLVICEKPFFYKSGFGRFKEQSVSGPLSNRMFKSEDNIIVDNFGVRRLTPLECERLQGFPDGWTDIGEWTDSEGKHHKRSDAPRYKALGNSIALPFWYWLLSRISAQYQYTPMLGSLFDGIGGFPLCWETINGKGTAKWASEIEEFPMAVTKIRFPE